VTSDRGLPLDPHDGVLEAERRGSGLHSQGVAPVILVILRGPGVVPQRQCEGRCTGPGGKTLQARVGPGCPLGLGVNQESEEGEPFLHQNGVLKDLLVVQGVLRGSSGEGQFQKSPELARSHSPPPWLDDIIIPLAQAIKNLLVVGKTTVHGDAKVICPLPPPADQAATDVGWRVKPEQPEGAGITQSLPVGRVRLGTLALNSWGRPSDGRPFEPSRPLLLVALEVWACGPHVPRPSHKLLEGPV
jgi:hypothetical protein